MDNSHAIAVALCAEDGLIDKLELETSLPKSDRIFLEMYQGVLSAGVSRRDHDRQFIDILRKWVVFLHKY